MVALWTQIDLCFLIGQWSQLPGRCMQGILCFVGAQCKHYTHYVWFMYKYECDFSTRYMQALI